MIREGTRIGGRYEVVGRIGTGGMADVYKAIDRVLNRYVAIKVLKSEFREDVNFVVKFRSEAQSAAGLTHPNIVSVYDVAKDRGVYYIVMELVEGITLKDYIQKKGKLSPKEVIGITLQVCAGIEVAHQNHIIHRDIKPQNIIISKEGKVKVTDFGIAKATSSNTISTNAMGSVHYTSPEQARGGFSDEKSDIYSLGITMYEMITGVLPFDGDSTVSIALKHLQEDMMPPSEYALDIPYSLEQIILKATQKSPDRRYANVALLVRDLKHSIQDPDGDFVRISPLANASKTRNITPEELEQIQAGAGYDDEGYDDGGYDEYYGSGSGNKKNESDMDPKMNKVIKILTIVAAVIFVGVMVVLIGNVTGALKFGPGVNVSEEKNIVPKVVGMTVEQAEKACAKAGIILSVIKEEPSAEYEKGFIFKQLTSEGTKLPEGTKLQVYVSSEKIEKKIEIPDVANKSEDDAIIELVKAGFKKKNLKVKTEEHATIEADKVIRTDPEIGTTVGEKSEITIYVSVGVGKTEMPYLEGRSREDAEELLKEAGLKGEAQEVESDEPVGRVISQGVEAGTELNKGTTVKYQVSKKTIAIPSINWSSGTETVKILVREGFTEVTQTTTETSEYDNDSVISIKTDSGQTLDKGQKIAPNTKIIVETATNNSGSAE